MHPKTISNAIPATYPKILNAEGSVRIPAPLATKVVDNVVKSDEKYKYSSS